MLVRVGYGVTEERSFGLNSVLVGSMADSDDGGGSGSGHGSGSPSVDVRIYDAEGNLKETPYRGSGGLPRGISTSSSAPHITGLVSRRMQAPPPVITEANHLTLSPIPDDTNEGSEVASDQDSDVGSDHTLGGRLNTWWKRTARSVLGVVGTPQGRRSRRSSFGRAVPAAAESSISSSSHQLSEAHHDICNSPPYRSRPVLDGGDQRSLWMPDEKCTACFGCSRTFHAFRRKHHCRICGRIFCYRCSNHFIEGQHRVCDHCHAAMLQHSPDAQRLLARGEEGVALQMMLPLDTLVSSPRSPLSYSSRARERAWSTTMARLGESRGSDASESTGRKRQLSSNLGLHSAEFSVSEGEESDARSENSARVDDTEVSASIWAHALTTFSVRSAPAADQQALSRPLENLFEGRDDFAGLKEIDLEAPQRSVSETRVHGSGTQEAEDSIAEGEAAATPSSRGDAQRGELRHAMLEHWKWTVKECCKACMGEYFTDDNYEVTMALAWQAVEGIQDKLLPLAEGGGGGPGGCGENNMNILKLVKVRTLTGSDYDSGTTTPSLEPSYYLRGAMFHHNVANSEMPLWRANAGILCIEGSIEFEAPNKSGYIPMDFLRAQEQSYIDIVVRKIVSLGGPATPVEILLCGGRVTRRALDALMEAGVSVCVHVPKHNLELAASAAGGVVLAGMDVLSVAHAQHMTHVVGVAQQWKIVPNDNPPMEGRVPLRSVNMVIKGGSNSRLASLCLKTVGHRSADRFLLKAARVCTKWAVKVGYAVLTQTEFFQDTFIDEHYASCHPLSSSPSLSRCTRMPLDMIVPASNNIDHVKRLQQYSWEEGDSQSLPAMVYMVGQAEKYASHPKPHTFGMYSDRNPQDKTHASDITLAEYVVRRIMGGGGSLGDSRNSGDTVHVPITGASALCWQHCHGRVIVRAERWSGEQVLSYMQNTPTETTEAGFDIDTWRYCRVCSRNVTPRVKLTKDGSRISLGKFLELFFHNYTATTDPRALLHLPDALDCCPHSVFRDHVHLFACRGAKKICSFEWRSAPCHSLVLSRDTSAYWGRDDCCTKAEDIRLLRDLALDFARGVRKLISELERSVLEWGLWECRAVSKRALEGIKAIESTLHAMLAFVVAAPTDRGDSLVLNSVRYEIFSACRSISHRVLECLQPLTDGVDKTGETGVSSPKVPPEAEKDAQGPSSYAATLPEAEARLGSMSRSTRVASLPSADDVPSVATALRGRSTSAPCVVGLPEEDQKGRVRRSVRELAVFAGQACAGIYQRVNEVREIIKPQEAKLTLHRPGDMACVVVDDDDVGSWVAYALASEQMKTKMRQLTEEFLNTSEGCPVCREEAWCAGNPLTTEDLMNHPELHTEPKLPPQLRDRDGDDDGNGESDEGRDTEWPTCTAGSGPRSYRTASGRGLSEAEALWVKTALLAGPEGATGDVSPHVDIEFSNEKHSWEVRVYYALQWHAFRHWMCGGDLEFIRSVRHTRRLRPAGGKSGASFYVSHNGRYIFKALKAREQDFIEENGEALFWYDAKRIFQNMPTTLIELYGMFTVTHKQAGGRQYRRTFIVMRHLEHHLSASQRQDLLLFDLKGVGPKRAFREATSSGVDGSASPDEAAPVVESSDPVQGPDVVLWDQNFREWTRGLPLTLSPEDYLYLDSAVRNDTYFLSKLYIVDYSLLLMLHRAPDNAGGGAFRRQRIYAPHECRAPSEDSPCSLACGPDLGPLQVSFGMIDYFRPYTWEKQLETLLKTAMSAGNSLAHSRGGGPSNGSPVAAAPDPEAASLLIPPMASSDAAASESGDVQVSGPVEVPLVRNASADARKLMNELWGPRFSRLDVAPTVIHPEDYAKRFGRAITSFFVPQTLS
ncbi:1-phosphatidylinositol-3-phosphate 5-kinase [Perkinsus olseni]|uniref:1-phosphatidylinositol-3-phosphate 5-kinase n=1 Tax=Perkinsus olseni TaxID=32597 RepID=A0A7J6MF88_PEROL|nr:1-phosphatidylinositol-3-phosphate 5-kinase [Perkinsus olseni]KAF4669840.1 1-phosphatidylinositol-3-phosphate 5-kinase [Perkinsus olseni]